MQVFVTGGVGFATDAHDVFSNIDTKLLFATVLLVLVLLGAIYRSVLVALSPLIVVFFAYTITQALVYALAKSGATVSSNSTSILIVLMFGVGTDYCLLLVSRYREELRRTEDKHEAMGRALRRAGPAIFASGMTVTLAMLTLALADNKNTSSLGPVAAISVFTAMVAGLTLLPTLLTIFGRRGFWPRRAMVAYDPEHPSVGGQGPWRRFGDWVLKRPVAALITTGALFIAGAFGLLAYKVDYSTTSFFKHSVEAVEGFDVLRVLLPGGHAGADHGPGGKRERTRHARRHRGGREQAAERQWRGHGHRHGGALHERPDRRGGRHPQLRPARQVGPERRASHAGRGLGPPERGHGPGRRAPARSTTTSTRRISGTSRSSCPWRSW